MKKWFNKFILITSSLLLSQLSLAANEGSLVTNVGNILYANLLYVTNEVGGKITTLVGCLVIALFVFDIGKMILQSHLSQISIGALIGNYLNRLITLAIVSAVLLLPVPSTLAINNSHNLYQVLLYYTMSMWLAIGGLFFPDAVANNIFITDSAGITVQTATGASIVLKNVAPGGIVSSLIGIPISIIQSGIAIACTLVGFFAGLIVIIIGIYVLFKTVSMVSIFISALFEYSVLITLASIYLPFMLYEGTKNKIGSKPLELFVTEGIKLVVTTGIIGIITTLFSTGYLTVSGFGIISGFMIAVAFSIMEKVMNNNNQIASSIINGGGLGVSTGNEFFAMANQVAMMGGAVMLMGANSIGSGMKAGINKFNAMPKDASMSDKLKGAVGAGVGRMASNPIRHMKNTFEKGIGQNARILKYKRQGLSLKEAMLKAKQETNIKVTENNIKHRKSALDNNIFGESGQEFLKTAQMLAYLIDPKAGYMLGGIANQITPDAIENAMKDDMRKYTKFANSMNNENKTYDNMGYNPNEDPTNNMGSNSNDGKSKKSKG